MEWKSSHVLGKCSVQRRESHTWRPNGGQGGSVNEWTVPVLTALFHCFWNVGSPWAGVCLYSLGWGIYREKSLARKEGKWTKTTIPGHEQQALDWVHKGKRWDVLNGRVLAPSKGSSCYLPGSFCLTRSDSYRKPDIWMLKRGLLVLNVNEYRFETITYMPPKKHLEALIHQQPPLVVSARDLDDSKKKMMTIFSSIPRKN